MSDNVIPFPKKPVMVPGWDVERVLLRDGDAASAAALQEKIELGFEPFAVTGYSEMVLEPLTRQPKAMGFVERVWLKRPAAPVPEGLEPGPKLA